MNSIPRLYIYEGVYSFECYATSLNSTKDKFGELVTTSSKYYVGEGEVSFKSDKIVILLNDKREEIILAEPDIPAWALGEKHISYYFPIVQWKACFSQVDICFFQFDSTENQELRIIPGYYEPHLVLSISKFKIDNIEQTQTDISIMGTDVHEFKIVPQRYQIEMNNLKYKYESYYGVPKYVNAKYEPKEYDIDTYLAQLPRTYIKPPFALNHNWK